MFTRYTLVQCLGSLFEKHTNDSTSAMKRRPLFLWVVCLLVACTGKSDDVLITKDGVSIIWRTSKFWQFQGGHNPIPDLVTSEDQLLVWDAHEVSLWDVVKTSEKWSRQDTIELKVNESVALYRRNGKAWSAVYKGRAGLFHGTKPVNPDNVPTLRAARPAIYHRQVRRDLRTLIMADAWADGEDAVVSLLAETVDAKTQGERDAHWAGARTKLSDAARQKVDQALLAAYRNSPSYFVILRAANHLNLDSPGFDEANRAALRALERAAVTKDSWGVHYGAKKLLPKLACSKAFEDERDAVKVACRSRKRRSKGK